MRDLLNTLGKTLLDVGNFGMLLVLFMYIYALVGLQFFANRFHFNADGVAVGIGEDGYYSAQVPRSNFDTLMNAFTTIFEVSLWEWCWAHRENGEYTSRHSILEGSTVECSKCLEHFVCMYVYVYGDETMFDVPVRLQLLSSPLRMFLLKIPLLRRSPLISSPLRASPL